MKTLDTVVQWIIPPALVLGQALPLPDAEATSGIVTEIIRSLGIVGALVWYMWYNTSVAQPKILADAAAEREKLSLLHKQELDDKRADYTKALAEQREMLNATLTNATRSFELALERITCKFEHRDLPCSKDRSSS